MARKEPSGTGGGRLWNSKPKNGHAPIDLQRAQRALPMPIPPPRSRRTPAWKGACAAPLPPPRRPPPPKTRDEPTTRKMKRARRPSASPAAAAWPPPAVLAASNAPPASSAWRVALSIAGAVAGTLALIAVFAVVREQGSQTGAVGRALDRTRDPLPIDGVAAEQLVHQGAAEAARECHLASSNPLRVAVVFGPSGRPQQASLHDPRASANERRCVVASLHRLRLEPFSGESVRVEVSVPPPW